MCRPDTGNRGGVRMHMEEITKDTGGGYGGGIRMDMGSYGENNFG